MNSWQYNGVAPWLQIVDWCVENTKQTYSSCETIYFPDEREYTLFLLRWS
jgi:hypothetical protein